MKKFSLLTVAALALTLASCSQDDLKEVDAAIADGSTIGFISNTSRAADVLTLQTLQDDAAGFPVFGKLANESGWNALMDGSNNYAYQSGVWSWVGQDPKWPTDDAAYSIDFYAYYAANDAGITLDSSDVTNLGITYAIPDINQTDIVAAKSTAAVRPAGDRLPLEFNHILSKVNFGITAGTDYVVHTQAVGFNNICSERKYLLATEDWDAQDNTKAANYTYLATANPAIASPAALVATDKDDMMVLPQSTVSWDPTAGAATVTGSHIYLIYRAELGTNNKAIGYKDAADHPDFDTFTAADQAKYGGKPLFVKVGYPLGSKFEPVKGMAYTYDINIGGDDSSNGYLIDENYYDEDGNRTDFEVEDKDINDPISDGYINFTVTVNEWVDAVVGGTVIK